MNYEELDPGIREHVRAIVALGYETTDSGDGVSKPDDAEGVLPFPHVVVVLDMDQSMFVEHTRRLYSFARANFGIHWVAELSWIPGQPAVVMVYGPEIVR